MGLLDLFKKKETNQTEKKEAAETVLTDDYSYIAEMHHVQGPWQQYDFLLAAGGYGWDYMISAAEYMANADLINIGTVSVAHVPNGEATEYIDEYRSCDSSFNKMESLKEEAANLGIGGISKTIGAPVKIVWFNQTRVIRVFSPVDDEEKFTKYVETVIRRTFGTPESMMTYKPVPAQK